MSTPLGSAVLGASTFCASEHGVDECDSKGLPLTLNSVNVLGRFQFLRSLRHAHLCAYLDAIKCDNGQPAVHLGTTCAQSIVTGDLRFIAHRDIFHAGTPMQHS